MKEVAIIKRFIEGSFEKNEWEIFEVWANTEEAENRVEKLSSYSEFADDTFRIVEREVKQSNIASGDDDGYEMLDRF